jgi:penicillin amidase
MSKVRDPLARRRLMLASAACVVLLTALGCQSRSPQTPAEPPLPEPPQVSGTIRVQGLTAPVTIVRDRSGVPHIRAANQDDLFFAQGFVQAEDRLFQLDLWRRSAQGRLSEVLGANFIERDVMTRRIQYRGDMAEEWASYGPDARQIADAFTRGINAWIGHLGDDLPREFALAGWRPERWRPEDLLNRTDAYVDSGGARDEVLRARLVAQMGAAAVDDVWPLAGGLRTRLSPDLDLSVITYGLGEMLGRVGTAPFFSGFSTSYAPGSNAWAVPASRTGTGAPLVAVDPHRSFDHPASRYLVHLIAPGWNVIGATAPWRPGVAIGHNEQVGWGAASAPVDVKDIFVERVNPANPRQVWHRGRWVDLDVGLDAILVKGRDEPFEYEQLRTGNGIVIGRDHDRHLAYALRWSGSTPGAASELGALVIDRASNAAGMREALAAWKLPAADFVFADRQGAVASQRAAAVPVRQGSSGVVPADGWSGANTWSGWKPPSELPHDDRSGGVQVSANGNLSRTSRILDVLTRGSVHGVADASRLQHDVHAWNADRLVPLLAAIDIEDARLAARRELLLDWNREIDAGSRAALLYVAWEDAMKRLLAARKAPEALVSELAPHVALVPALTSAAAWFGGDASARDRLLVDALVAASDDERVRTGEEPATLFRHPLGIGQAAARFNVGPFRLPGYAETVFSVSADRRIGPSFRGVFDLADWDRSVATLAPGQSESVGSPHFADLASTWAAGGYVPLPFSAAAIAAAAEATLTLVPDR